MHRRGSSVVQRLQSEKKNKNIFGLESSTRVIVCGTEIKERKPLQNLNKEGNEFPFGHILHRSITPPNLGGNARYDTRPTQRQPRRASGRSSIELRPSRWATALRQTVLPPALCGWTLCLWLSPGVMRAKPRVFESPLFLFTRLSAAPLGFPLLLLVWRNSVIIALHLARARGRPFVCALLCMLVCCHIPKFLLDVNS